MVTYGEWQEPREHEVLIHAPGSAGYAAHPSPGVLTPAGIEHLSGEAYPGWAFNGVGTSDPATGPYQSKSWTASAAANGPAALGGVSSGWATSALSECAWPHAFAATDGPSWDLESGTCQPIDLTAAPKPATPNDSIQVGWVYTGGYDDLIHSESWRVRITSYRLMCYRAWHAHMQEGVAPLSSYDWPEGVVGVDFGDAAITDRELITAEVRPWTVGGTFDDSKVEGFLKQAGVTDPDWMISPARLDGEPLPRVVAGGGDTGTRLLDVGALEALMAAVPSKTDAELNADPLLPRMGFRPLGDWPGNWGGPDDSMLADSFELAVYMKFRTPAWRYVYADEGIIYRAPRRVFPRDDGLTGGARRTWPPSKGYQWGNRVDGSGYL